MRTFLRHRSYEEIKQVCAEQDIPFNDEMYCNRGWDTVCVGGPKPHGVAIFDVCSGRFFGRTPEGIQFSSESQVHEGEPWFQALLSFFYVEAIPA